MQRLMVMALAVCAELTLAGCSADRASGPGEPDYKTAYGCEMDPACNRTMRDPNPAAPGYWMGTTVTPARCISVTGAGINDLDDDALHDPCEDLLAFRFRPALRSSVYDCDMGMEPYWAAKAFPNRGVVRIAYLFSYYSDCGVPGCSVAPCSGHQGDSEFITVDLRYDAAAEHWYVSQAFYAAHWLTEGNSSELMSGSSLEYPERHGGYPRVWVAHGKHGSYRSRDACNNGAYLDADDCNESYPDNGDTRIYHSSWRNVGSAAKNFINLGTCVTGGRLVNHYPQSYGIECYWVPGDKFGGWSRYPQANDAGPYHTALTVMFECHSYTLIGDDQSGYQSVCADAGVRPSQNRGTGGEPYAN
jgi:hypothetical protein